MLGDGRYIDVGDGGAPKPKSVGRRDVARGYASAVLKAAENTKPRRP